MLIGWITRLVAVVAVVVVVGYDGTQVASAQLGARQDAADAASAGAVSWMRAHSGPSALTAAGNSAARALPSDESLVDGSFRVAADGSVTLSVHRTTGRTLLLHHIGWLQGLVAFDVRGSAPAPAA